MGNIENIKISEGDRGDAVDYGDKTKCMALIHNYLRDSTYSTTSLAKRPIDWTETPLVWSWIFPSLSSASVAAL